MSRVRSLAWAGWPAWAGDAPSATHRAENAPKKIYAHYMGCYPVAAMVRLPTRKSDGKANLHQGAVGAGIDLKTGKTTHAILAGHPVTHHPDTGHLLEGIVIALAQGAGGYVDGSGPNREIVGRWLEYLRTRAGG